MDFFLDPSVHQSSSDLVFVFLFTYEMYSILKLSNVTN